MNEELELSFPPLEAEEVKKTYESANVILEYGSGGSSVLAASIPGKQIYSVESDLYWAAKLKNHLLKKDLPSFVTVYPVDIGPTGKWGRPISEVSWRTFHHYPMRIWDEPDFVHPDVILIDGRFRVACLLYAAMRIERQVTVLFDDYVGRDSYHVVEKFFKPERIVGRLAVFVLEPNRYGVELLPYVLHELGKTAILDGYSNVSHSYSAEYDHPYQLSGSLLAKEWLNLPNIKLDNKNLKDQLKSLSKEIDTLSKKYSESLEQLAQKNLHINDLESDINQVLEQLKLKQNVDQMNTRLNEELFNVKNEKDEMNRRYEESLNQMSQALNQMNQRISQISQIQLSVHQLEEKLPHSLVQLEQQSKLKEERYKKKIKDLQAKLDNQAKSNLKYEQNIKRLKVEHSIEITALQKKITQMKKVILEISNAVDKLRKALQSAQNWQGRSWFKRAFHKWRAPKISIKDYSNVIAEISKPQVSLPKPHTVSREEPVTKAVISSKSEIVQKQKSKSAQHAALMVSSQLMAEGKTEEAYQYANQNIPDELSYTKHLLKANDAISKKNENLWLSHLNDFLKKFELAPIILKTDGMSLFERFSTATLPIKDGGPLITVIMPAWNAQNTVRVAANSILNQTWRNIELIIVDDASTDDTWSVIQDIAASDHRVKIKRNSINVGPYVSKNIALMEAKGEWITGHDADDWAHPQRLEKHVIEVLSQPSLVLASVGYMIRMIPSGKFDWFCKVGPISFDGVSRIAFISCLYKKEFLRNELGFWDSVRFGADSEMIARARLCLGDNFHHFKSIGMLCLDVETSLTNNVQTGISKATGLSPSRTQYKESWGIVHEKALCTNDFYLPFPLDSYRYDVAPEMRVPLDQIRSLLSSNQI